MTQTELDQNWESRFFSSGPQLFAVVSWGATATLWVAKALNSHPEILCLHNASTNWALNSITKTESSIDDYDYYDYMLFLAKIGDGYQAAGEVHGIPRHKIPELRKKFGNKFNAVVLVREPISRLKSQTGFFIERFPDKIWNIDYIDNVIKTKNLSLPKNDYEHKLFVHGANMLNAIIDEVNVGKIFKFEDLTLNYNIFKNFVQEITNDKVTVDEELFTKILKIKRVNIHKKNEIDFEDWQIDVIKKVVDEKAWKLYLGLGYSKPNFL